MLTSTTYAYGDFTVMRMSGVLNARTYMDGRDSVVKVAVDDPRALIIDVNDLEVHDAESWAVFTSARWCMHQWPEIPIVLIARDRLVRKRLTDLSVARYVPVYDTVAAAAAAIGGGTCRYRHRARERFEPRSSSVAAALIFVHEHLVAWSMRDRVPVASTALTVFAENALGYTDAGFDVRLEGTDDEVIVAVSDSSTALAVRPQRPLGSCPAGLDIVAALCRHWGNTPTSTGKTVWARIGPGDTFAGIGGRVR
jgi:hypothetical protein